MPIGPIDWMTPSATSTAQHLTKRPHTFQRFQLVDLLQRPLRRILRQGVARSVEKFLVELGLGHRKLGAALGVLRFARQGSAILQMHADAAGPPAEIGPLEVIVKVHLHALRELQDSGIAHRRVGKGIDTDAAVARLYRARALPSSFLIDRQGVVRYVRVGPLTRDVLEEELTKLAR